METPSPPDQYPLRVSVELTSDHLLEALHIDPLPPTLTQTDHKSYMSDDFQQVNVKGRRKLNRGLRPHSMLNMGISQFFLMSFIVWNARGCQMKKQLPI